MRLRVVVLGAGFGGLELSTLLSEALGDGVDLTLIDRNDCFFFGFSKLEVMFGRQNSQSGAAALPRHRQNGRALSPGKYHLPSTRSRGASQPTRGIMKPMCW